MIKVFINPDYYKVPLDADNGGIRRCADAERKHLPTFGIEVVHNPDDAHIILNHGGAQLFRPGVPNVHQGHGAMWSRYAWGTGMQEVNENVVNS